MGLKTNINKAIDIYEKNKSEFKQFGFKDEVIKDLLKRKIKANYHFFLNQKWDRKEIDKDLNHFYLNLEGLKEWIKDYSDIKKAILNSKLMIICISDNGFNHKVYYLKNNQVAKISLTTLKSLNTYSINYKKGSVCVSAYGTSRALEIILSMGYKLGLRFDEIPQKQITIY